MIRKNPVHLSYSAKKELLEAWKEAQKEEGMTKVLFSRRHKTSLSTFTKWCAQAESIEQVEDDDRKHLSNKRKKVRGAYTKKRPTDERKGLLYDWLQTAPKSINQADLRGEARRLWPEFCDEDYPLCKTSGSFRKFCLRFSERYCPSSTAADVDKDDANSACNRQNSDTKEQTIDIAVSEDDDQAHSSVHDTVIQPLKSSVEASGCDEPGVCAACGHRLTLRSAARADDAMEKQPAKCPPSTHISIEDKNNIVESAWTNNDQSQFLCDWQDSDLERQVLDVFATGKDERVQSSVDKLKTTPLKRHACNQSGGGDSVCDLHCCAVQISDPSVVQAVPSTMKAANNLNNLDNEHIKNKSVCQQEVVEIIDSPQEKRTNSSPTISESSADEGDYSVLYEHIDVSLPLKGATRRLRPARMARFGSSSKLNSRIHNDRCYRCNRRSPCVDYQTCTNVQSYHECASERCSAGKYCKNNVIQRRRFPQTSVVKDRKFGFGLRLDEDVPKNTKIIEYVGQLITKDEFLRRKKKYKGSLSWYMARVSQGSDNLYVDAKDFGNLARFINHSCLPNCRFETWYVDKAPRLVVVARFDLKRGSILTLHYMDDKWNIPCLCGFCDGSYLAPPSDV